MLPAPVGDPPVELLFADCAMPDEASDVVDVDSEHLFDVYSEEFFDVYSDVYFDCETP